MPQNAENESSDAIDINDNGVSRKYTLFGEHYELLSQLLRTVLVPVPKWLRQKKKKKKKKTNNYTFGILCGASITGGVINLNIYSGKRKHFEYDSSQE